MIELIVLGFAAGELAVLDAAARNGLRAVRLATVGGIGYIAAWIIGAFLVSEFVGEKAPLGLALGWLAACFAAIVFLKSRPEHSEVPAGPVAAVWAVCWRGVLAVLFACVSGVVADFFVLFLAGFLGFSLASDFLYLVVVAVYVVTCVLVSYLFFLLSTKKRLGAVHATLTTMLRRES